MRDERESEIASKFKYGMAGWLANRQRLWRTRRADLAAERRETQLAGVRLASSLLAARHIHMHAPHGSAVDARTDGPVMRRSDASQSGDAELTRSGPA